MKSNTFKHSLIAVGVTAALSLSTSAMANTSSGTTTTDVLIKNVAVANYDISGVKQPEVKSNEVIVKVSEQLSFSLLAQNADGNLTDNVNNGGDVAPNGIIPFKHRLQNTGNRDDSYTVNLSNVETGDDAQYDVPNSRVSYQVFNADGTAVSGAAFTGTDVLVSDFNNLTFPLTAGQYVDFTINAKTLGNKGGNRQDLTLTATSSLLPTASKTLTNTDKSVTKLPTFSIVKTVMNSLDLNNANDTAAYKIVIKNPTTTYSANATDIIITDNLPAGLLTATALTTDSIIITGNATKGTLTQTDKGFELKGVNLPVGDSITINFTVKKDPNAALANNALNHIKVTDDLDNNPATDNTLIDSTDSTVENVTRFYPTDDTDFTNGTNATGNDGNDSTQPLSTIKRALTLTNPTIKEIAPTSGTAGQVTHETIITNTGQNTEGNVAGGLTFTITDNDNGTPDAVNLVSGSVTLTYDPDGSGPKPVQTAVGITPNSSGVYDIKTALTDGIAPTGTVTISYKVSSVNAETGSSEDTVVTLTASGKGAPTGIVPITDRTDVRGLTLIKSQALDATCDGTADTAFSSSKDALLATPNQCVIYQIVATNTSSTARGFNLQNLVISDATANFSTTANYRGNASATTTSTGSGTVITIPAALNSDKTAIATTVNPLVPQGTATMQFSVQIKTDR
ncbi:hypothetical protein [Psychrobacter okhotskensis]|uniref:hypothetical protein n=1 Tax=Psychrobacter okhotskensis TaxID=212403 RepID=UPI00191849B8|nr:hypothetical protein [Psychrobacter okhotskensis]